MSKVVYLLLFGLVGLMLAASVWAQVCTPPPPGMVSWWPADGNFNDIQDGNNGTPNGVTFAAGKVGQGFNFTGTGNEFIDIADAPNLRPPQFTVDLWATRNGPGQNEDDFGPVLIQKAIDSTQFVQPLLSYGIWWRNVDGKIRALVEFVGDICCITNVLTSGNSFPVGSTVHVALTYDGIAIKLYVNANLEAQVPVSKTVAYGPGTVTIGSTVQVARNFTFPRTFNGVIDEVEIFNRALTDTEILAIFAADSAGKCKPPAAAISALIAQVVSIVPPAQQPPLTSTLQAAQNSLARGNRTAAINQLHAFIHQVQAQQRSGRLDPATANSLIALAQGIINGI